MSASQILFVLFGVSLVASVLLALRGRKLWMDYNYRCDGWFVWSITCLAFSIFVLYLANQAVQGNN